MEKTEQVAPEPQQEVALVDEEGLNLSTGNLNILQDESTPSDDEPSPSWWSKNMSFSQLPSFIREKDKVVDIVTFESGQPQIKERELHKVLEKVANLPLVIVSMIGVARSGKSFLLNLYINYLTYLELNGNNENWEFSTTKTKGFPWGQSRTAVTRGISVWSKPFIIEPENGKKMAILIMDCEGEGHIKGDVRIDQLVTYISLQIASVQLLNIDKLLQPINLTRLKFCSAVDEAVEFDDLDEDEDSLFRSLIFIRRNYNEDEIFGEDDRIFNELLNDPKSDVKLINGIKKSFKSITTFNFPHPGRKVDRAKEATFDWRLPDVDEEFLNAAKNLFQRVSHMDSRREQQHCWDNAIKPVQILQAIRKRCEDKDLPPLVTPKDFIEDMTCRKIYFEVSNMCQGKMLKHVESSEIKKYSDGEELKSALEKTAEAFRKRFQREAEYHQVSESPSFRGCQSELEENIIDAQLFAMSYFTKEKLKDMEAELKAAEEDKLESLLVQQLQGVTALIEKSKRFFQEAVTNNQKLVNELEKQQGEAENWRVKKRAERKLDAAKKSPRKKEDHATDVKMLEKHQEGIRKKIKSVANDKKKYIEELKKEKAAHKEELKKLETEVERRANLRGGIAIALVVGTFAAAVGGFLAAPYVLGAGAAVAGASAFAGFAGFLFGN